MSATKRKLPAFITSPVKPREGTDPRLLEALGAIGVVVDELTEILHENEGPYERIGNLLDEMDKYYSSLYDQIHNKKVRQTQPKRFKK